MFQCAILNEKLESLLKTLNEEAQASTQVLYLSYNYLHLKSSLYAPVALEIIRVCHFDNFEVLKEKKGWSGGAMVLGKLPVPGHPTNLD